jgi:hypothetical protein
MPAAKPTKRIIKTRANANEASLPRRHRAVVIGFSPVVRSGGWFDGSLAAGFLEKSEFLEGSDSAEVRPGFIGVPPSAAQQASSVDDSS